MPGILHQLTSYRRITLSCYHPPTRTPKGKFLAHTVLIGRRFAACFVGAAHEQAGWIFTADGAEVADVAATGPYKGTDRYQDQAETIYNAANDRAIRNG